MKTFMFIKNVGFVSDATKEVIGALRADPSVLNGQIIEKMRVSKGYFVFKSKTHFTIYSRFMVTKAEAEQISTILKRDYFKADPIGRKGE